MRKYLLIFVICLSVYISGCVAPVIVAGAAGAGATYSLATDSVSDNVDAKIPEVVDAFINEVNKRNGSVMFASISEGKVKAEIKEIKYTLDVKSLTKNSSRLTITARKTYNLLPARDEAVEFYTKVAERLK
ncbi:MAG: DUF3568 family protein [Flexistipes sinusarabici]|uniref:DUF3568 family protein n=1 Tax=Flexistipes sinusarabici TaxID=2352 RepID=A0A5D0MGV6_FLESI|nr:DUF3568 family protein [Flexistipes sinusarabici]TYB32944.1 MAG: DUF3568 family protein [Flexistipes sinusarabici]